MPREVEGILDGQDLLSRTGGKSMNERPYSSDPADVLVDVIVRQQREGLLDGLRQVLEHGPPGQAPDSSDIVRHKWFWPLGEDDKAMVLGSIRQSIDRALLGAMMALDSPFHVGDQIYEPVSTWMSTKTRRLGLKTAPRTEPKGSTIPPRIPTVLPAGTSSPSTSPTEVRRPSA
jgi:hypothetical protein